jgi:hypothetical protein
MHTRTVTFGFLQLHTANVVHCTGKAESEGQNKTIQAIENGALTHHLQRLIVGVRTIEMNIRLIILMLLLGLAMGCGSTLPPPTPPFRLADRAEATMLAERYTAKHNLDWGEPIKIEEKGSTGYWIWYATPEAEVALLGPRVVTVNRQSRATTGLPRR